MGWGRLAAGPGGLFLEGPSSGSLADSEHNWGLVKGDVGLQEFKAFYVKTTILGCTGKLSSSRT